MKNKSEVNNKKFVEKNVKGNSLNVYTHIHDCDIETVFGKEYSYFFFSVIST